jgi:hypothetical protein
MSTLRLPNARLGFNDHFPTLILRGNSIIHTYIILGILATTETLD